MRALALVFSGVSILALAGCNGVPLATQWKLRNFNLATADVSQIRVAARPPAWATLTPEKTMLVAKLDMDGGADGGAGRKLDLHLRRSDSPADQQALARLTPQAESLTVYAIAPGDLAAAREFQAAAQIAKAAGRHGKGGLDIAGDMACRHGDVPADGPVSVDVFIHPSDEVGWLPLLEAYDVKPQLTATKSWEEIARETPSCGKMTKRADAGR